MHISKVQLVRCDKCASQSIALSQATEECPLSVTSEEVQTELPSNSGMNREGSLHNAVSF